MFCGEKEKEREKKNRRRVILRNNAYGGLGMVVIINYFGARLKKFFGLSRRPTGWVVSGPI